MAIFIQLVFLHPKNNTTFLTHNQQNHGRLSFLTFDIVVASLCIILAAFVFCFFCLCKKLRMRPQKYGSEEEEKENSTHKCAATWTFADVDKATDNFSPRRLLGRGRHAAVYKGIISDGRVVAVKRIDPLRVLRNAGNLSFAAEMRALSRAHHPNVVSLLGFCEFPGERILVTEFLAGKSLRYHLQEGGVLLGWSRRAKIAAEVAKGLEYLHEGTAPYIVHGDLKPSNVLLDSTWTAKVADYGLQNHVGLPDQMAARLGYVDPEYFRELNLTKASDVYSFGVVVLELLSGRRCFGGGGGGGGEEPYIVDWAVPLIMGARVAEILDPKLAAPPDLEPLVRMAEVACRCVEKVRKKRPTILEVVEVLKVVEINVEEAEMAVAVAVAAASSDVHFRAYESKSCRCQVPLYIA